MNPVSILYLEDSPLDMELALALLKRAGICHSVHRVQTEHSFFTALTERCNDLILADYSLPGFDGLTALRLAREHCPETPFIFVSGAMGEEVAIDSLHDGATDYVLKHRLHRLAPAIRRALNEAEEKRARRLAERERETLFELEREARAQAEARARELGQVNAELERFTYAASHDLQEPLRMVKAYAQLLARRYRPLLDESGLVFIGFIESGVSRMENLIQDLLTYSRVVHDQTQDLQPLELGALVNQTLTDLNPLIAESGAAVTVGALPTVLGDGRRISRVFENLLSNSLKYRNSDDPMIEISAERDRNKWLIKVKDNGIGFEPRHSEEIFDLFKRLHGQEYSGTGVGLAIVRRVIEQQGGEIWAESEPGKGTTFFFTLQQT